MASVNVTLNGVICDLYGRTITGPVKIVGEMMYTDLGVGGGPMPPGEGDKPPRPPVGIWPGPGPLPHPEHPIVIPEPIPPQPPESGTKPPPADSGGWGYYDGRWGYFPGPGEPGPKA